jgi:UDPglucose 6-dehydrogenase
MSRIIVVGSGVVGTATGRGFIEAGHDVTFIDVLRSRIDTLRGLGFQAGREIDLEGESSFILLTLPTPNVGRRYDLSAFISGVTAVGRALKQATAVHTVVVRSTVPPGTTDELVCPILEQESGKLAEEGFTVAANPEFLRAASAADDFRWPWMTVIASRNKRTQERLRFLLQPFGGEIRVFSFWNEMWLIADKLGIDPDDVSSTVARSAEGSFNLEYGIRGGAPYGGVCLPKDTNAFLGFAAERSIPMPMLEAVIAVNDMLERAVNARFGEPMHRSGTAERANKSITA